MAIHTTFPGSRTEPAEYSYTEPVYCSVCGAEHDYTQIWDSWQHTSNDEPVCIERCKQAAEAAAYRQDITEAVTGMVAKLAAELDRLHDFHSQVCHDDAFKQAEDATEMVMRWKQEAQRLAKDQPPSWDEDAEREKAELAARQGRLALELASRVVQAAATKAATAQAAVATGEPV